jgi:hypothetical protein
MLTYASTDDPRDILRNVKRHSKFMSTEWICDTTLVFDGDDLVLVFNNRPTWLTWSKRCRHLKRASPRKCLGRHMERRIRLIIKLRAHRARLIAKAGHNGTPAKQPTSKAC